MSTTLLKYPLILVSASPRRYEIVQKAGLKCTTLRLDADESYPSNILPENVAEFIAWKKAKAIPNPLPNHLYLTADTIVLHQNKIFGKPKDASHATEMLHALSGQTHTVYSGIALRLNNAIYTDADLARVTFKKLTQYEIEAYIAQNQPFDKAGAYGVQDWMGMVGVTSLQGSFYTVMGLPVHLLYALLQKINSIDKI